MKTAVDTWLAVMEMRPKPHPQLCHPTFCYHTTMLSLRAYYSKTLFTCTAQAGRRMNQGHELQNTPTQPVSTQEPQLPHTGDPFTGCYRSYDQQPDAIRQCPADTVHRACAHAPFFPEKARNTWIVLALCCPSTAGFYAFPLLRSWQSGKILRHSQEDKSLSFWAQTFLCVLAKQEGEGDGNYSLWCKNKNVTKKKNRSG